MEFALTAASPAYADLDYQPLISDGFVLLMPPIDPLGLGRGALGRIEVAALDHISMPLPLVAK